tara:strand:+ start:596 stop:1138 length:543 start_codon:yes stop_codon:yes gene_type:complete
MNISKVKTSIKIGDFYLKENSPNFIGINYCVDNSILKNEDGRVYLICSDNLIKKIGGSQSKGGIKSTISFYVNSMQGSPGKPRFIIHLLIRDELLLGKKCDIHMITSPKVKAQINGLFISKDKEIAAFKEMEDLCKKDYFDKLSRYPEWNFQENSIPYPSDYSMEHVKYHENRINNNTEK